MDWFKGKSQLQGFPVLISADPRTYLTELIRHSNPQKEASIFRQQSKVVNNH